MITEKDLQEAIAECQGERNPNANTCIKLAAFYTIRDHLFPHEEKQLTNQPVSSQIGDTDFEMPSAYSYAPPPDEAETIIEYYSDTEFGRLIDGKKASDIWPVVDELVSDAVKTINPRLYEAFIQKIQA